MMHTLLREHSQAKLSKGNRGEQAKDDSAGE